MFLFSLFVESVVVFVIVLLSSLMFLCSLDKAAFALSFALFLSSALIFSHY